ncbi:MAG: RluA family pseudouridine synthase [Anaerostipes sp.]|nr:RluA family pseudouridine synthase [Anaerostipes sp.]
MRKKKDVKVLYVDQDIIVCEKPQGMPTVSDKTGDLDVVSCLKNYLCFQQGAESLEVFVVHRLDRPVGGVMVFARTKEAAGNLSEQIRNHQFDKCYQAVLTGWLPEEDGTFTDYLLKDSKSNTTKVVSKDTKDAREAVLDYEVLDMVELDKGKYTYCLIDLKTGRHHQIRVQFAKRGCGIWGDTKYNPKFQKTKKIYKEIGLYATKIEFLHPRTKELIRYKVEAVGEAFDMILSAEE